MITASVVLYKTPREDVDSILKSFAPGADRRLFLLDNSPEYDGSFDDVRDMPFVEYIFNGSISDESIRRRVAIYHLGLIKLTKLTREIKDFVSQTYMKYKAEGE